MKRAAQLPCLALVGFVGACTPFERSDGPPASGRMPAPAEVVPRDEPISARGNPPFYEVFGQRYHVMDKRSDYTERGVASWYGKKFHGRSTASGEPYDMYALSAAHKTLPIPAYVEVTNLSNGKKVVVRVNDRGPFVDNRLIDLSYAAASRIDMIRDGTALVEIRTLDPRPARAASAARTADPLFLQVGAFGDLSNAVRLKRYLASNGMGNVTIKSDSVNGRQFHRVRVGPVPNVREFDRLVERARSLDLHDTHLALD